jgi:hypothetical protein
MMLSVCDSVVPQAKSKLIIAKANRASSQQDLAAAEQQLLASRAQRSRLKQHLSQSSQVLLDSGLDVSWTWDQLQQLCAVMHMDSSTVSCAMQRQQCITQAAQRSVSPHAAAADEADSHGRLVESHEQEDDAVSCLERAVLHFKCGSAPELVQFVEAQVQAAKSLKDATCAL